MRALLIEPTSSETYPFIDRLHAATHCCVRHDQDLDSGLHTMGQQYCDLVLVGVNGGLGIADEIVDRLRSRADELLLKQPDIILLLNRCASTPDVLRFRDRGIMCICRDRALAIYDEAQLIFWKRATRKHRVAIRVDFRNGHHFIYVGTSQSQVELGAQLKKTAVTVMAKGTCDVDYIADQLGVCRATPKKYFSELRHRFITEQEQSNIPEPERNIFWMEKRPGGTVCGVRAHVTWS